MLTERMKAFARAYASNGCNGLEAAGAAGYTGNDNTLKVRASKLLRVPEVAEEIQRLLAAPATLAISSDAIEVTAEEAAPLTDLEQCFVEAFAESLNFREAARRAGADEREGYKLKRKPNVALAIAMALEERRELNVVSRLEREEFFSRVIRGEITETKIVGEETIEVCPLGARLRATEQLGKLAGDYVRMKLPPSGAGGSTIRARNALVFVDNGRGPPRFGGGSSG